MFITNYSQIKKIKPITYGDYEGIINTIIYTNFKSEYCRNRKGSNK